MPGANGDGGGGAMLAREAERRIRAYERLGIHRTGWGADDAAADWLVEELAAIGVEGRVEEFEFPQLHIRRAELRIGGRAVPGVPLYDGGTTGREGISAPLADAPDGALAADGGPVIAVWEVPQSDTRRLTPAVYETLDALAAAGAVGVVMVMGDEHGEPVLRNAERPDQPLALPVLQVAPKDAGDGLRGEGALVVEAERRPGAARNVAAEIAGTDPALAPVVLMTPKSGWYTCAAERGGGLAVWLAVAEAFAQQPGERTLKLIASSGHELHHYGLDAWLDGPTGVPARDAHVWLHLGASIGAKRGEGRVGAVDEGLMALAKQALAEHGIEREPMAVGFSGFGEARNIAERGGRYISLLGGHPYFHSPNDVFEKAVDAEALAAHAVAWRSLAAELARSAGAAG